jgi:hypothetical protein
MHHNQRWYWNAPEDPHGTTMNILALKRPRTYKNYMKDDESKSRAQWTRVSVMPTAVVTAVERAEA